jgi:hypothetical protein
LGAGTVALGGAVAFEISRQNAEDEAARDDRQITFKSKIDKMEARKTTAQVFLGVGGALVVTGGVLLAVELLAPSPKTQASIGIGVNGPGISAFGTF